LEQADLAIILDQARAIRDRSARRCWLHMKKRVSTTLLLVPPLLVRLLFMKSKSGVGETIGSTVGIVWIFVSIPVSILVFLDWFRSPSTGGLHRALRNVARVPVLLFGGLALLIGVAVLVWIAYNLLIERQPQFRWTSLEGVGAMAAMIMFGIHLVRASLGRQE
jgi:hypothetical protein